MSFVLFSAYMNNEKKIKKKRLWPLNEYTLQFQSNPSLFLQTFNFKVNNVHVQDDCHTPSLMLSHGNAQHLGLEILLISLFKGTNNFNSL